MAINNILLAYNGSDSSDNALAAAIAMQSAHDAHLTALLAHGPSQLKTNLKPWMVQTIVDTVSELEDEQYSAIKERFFAKTEDHIIDKKLHWIHETGEASKTVSDHARLYDITIVGRHDAMQSERHLALNPEQIALHSGRPVLVVPRNFKIDAFNNHAVIAWDGKRAAVRALADAMDILCHRKRVTVLTVESSEDTQSDTGIDITTALARHSISAEFVQIKKHSQQSTEQSLLQYCSAYQPGLLIMGAYENNRFLRKQNSQLTDSILKNSSIPVFMSY